jgi:pSer/pThr/pTyr-binding forkhead associated (FHA) protein
MINKDIENNNWFLEGMLESGKKWIIPINKFPFFIGRSSTNDLSISSNDISRKHAQILRFGNNLMLKDLESTNGTFINDKIIKDPTSLINQDKIKFGKSEFKIINKNEIKSGEYTLTKNSKPSKAGDDSLDEFELTSREKEVFSLLLEGKSTKAISKILNITEGTAKNYVLSIFKKTNVHTRVELVRLFSKMIK